MARGAASSVAKTGTHPNLLTKGLGASLCGVALGCTCVAPHRSGGVARDLRVHTHDTATGNHSEFDCRQNLCGDGKKRSDVLAVEVSTRCLSNFYFPVSTRQVHGRLRLPASWATASPSACPVQSGSPLLGPATQTPAMRYGFQHGGCSEPCLVPGWALPRTTGSFPLAGRTSCLTAPQRARSRSP